MFRLEIPLDKSPRQITLQMDVIIHGVLFESWSVMAFGAFTCHGCSCDLFEVALWSWLIHYWLVNNILSRTTSVCTHWTSGQLQTSCARKVSWKIPAKNMVCKWKVQICDFWRWLFQDSVQKQYKHSCSKDFISKGNPRKRFPLCRKCCFLAVLFFIVHWWAQPCVKHVSNMHIHARPNASIPYVHAGDKLHETRILLLTVCCILLNIMRLSLVVPRGWPDRHPHWPGKSPHTGRKSFQGDL